MSSPVESACAPKMPDWQFRFGLSGLGQRRSFVYEALSSVSTEMPCRRASSVRRASISCEISILMALLFVQMAGVVIGGRMPTRQGRFLSCRHYSTERIKDNFTACR